MKLNAAGNFPGYELGIAYVIVFRDKPNALCRWEPINPTGGPTGETMEKKPDPVSPPPNQYLWTVILDISTAPLEAYELIVTWSPDDLPYTENEPPNCDAQEWNLPQILPIGQTKTLTLRPLPDWVCDNDQARQWATDNPLP